MPDPRCQSCGMPLSKDPARIANTPYCSYCFDGSQFKQPDFTLEQMQKLVEQKLREQGVPGFVAKWLAGSTKKLQRWT